MEPFPPLRTFVNAYIYIYIYIEREITFFTFIFVYYHNFCEKLFSYNLDQSVLSLHSTWDEYTLSTNCNLTVILKTIRYKYTGENNFHFKGG